MFPNDPRSRRPQANEPITILYQTSEDGIADTIKPRLERAQADCTRIKIIDESKTPLRFDDTRLEAAVRQENARLLILDPLSAYIGESISMNQANEVRSAFRSLYAMAQRTGCAVLIVAHRLLILDPLSAYIGESISMNQANEVRSAFRSLYAMAQRTGCAVLIVAHMNKMNGTSALYRTSGSIDVAGAVRSILTVTKYRKSATQRVLVPVKSNLAPAGNGLLLEVTDHVEWLDQLEEADADQLLNGNQGPAVLTKQQQAEQGLLQLLQNGPVSHKEIILHFSRQGISKRTVELAKSNLPIKSIRIKDGWLWQLEEQP